MPLIKNDTELSFKGIEADKGTFLFSSENTLKSNSIDFSGAKFNCPVSFNGLKSSCVIDLTQTKLEFPIDFDKSEIGFQYNNKFNLKNIFIKEIVAFCFYKKNKKIFSWIPIKCIKNRKPFYFILNEFKRLCYPPLRDDSTAFRRLKKLAQDNDDYIRVLDFFAKEIRSSYHSSLIGFKAIPYYFYDLFSDFGRSIQRPFWTLCFFSLVVFPLIYNASGKQSGSYWDAINFSMSHTIPFFAGALNSRKDSAFDLFGDASEGCFPDWIHLITFSQGIISAILVFLILLALRNMYRT